MREQRRIDQPRPVRASPVFHFEYIRRFADRVVGLADSQIAFDAAPSELTDAQLERIYAGRSTTQPANAPAEPPVMLEPSLEMSR
jgi:phosphonate transport system ATP-binding protein